MSFSVIDSLKKTLMVKPHPAGVPFIAVGAIAAALFLSVSKFLFAVFFIFTIFCLYFFRDPVRVTPTKSSLVVSPGDGLVSAIDGDVMLPAEIRGDDTGRYTRISIFLSVLDVHVNRIPIASAVMKKIYKPGKFLNAELDKASEENERCSVLLKTAEGRTLCLVQIAGLIARRIVNDLKEGQSVAAGSRYGIIRFGSRVDLYIPDGVAPLVCVGQRAVGGETVLADFDSREQARKGTSI
ncbi:MAG TPA: phosphatidylserine decarboxylase [Patescibacteria group bacterium]|nr:phosphatidylserine decarboxylase [Patescibacteria group bacterium]